MPFLNTSWFALLVSLVIALVVSTGSSIPTSRSESWLYYGIELFILTAFAFVAFRLIVIAVFKLTRKTSAK